MSWDQSNPTYDLLKEEEGELRTDQPLVPYDRGPVATFDVREFLSLSTASGMRDDVAMLKASRRLGTALGAKAFYSWKQAGETIEGPSVHALDGLAKVYGNLWRRCAIDQAASTPDRVALIVQIIDMRAIDISERPAFASISPAPGKYAGTPDGRARWFTMQLQSGISKAVRNGLQHAIPRYLQDAVVNAAKAAERESQGKDLEKNRKTAVSAFSKVGISVERLIVHMGLPVEQWGPDELVALRGLYSAIEERQIDADSIGQAEQPRQGQGDGMPVQKPTPAPTAAPMPVQAPPEATKAPAVQAPSAAALKSLEQGFPEVATQARTDLGLHLTVPASSFTPEQRLELARRIEQSKHPEDRVWG